MRLLPSDPDVATVVGRIHKGDIDLQPDFQRGEVWSYAKKQRLIDSILREWHVPPIHVIELRDSARQEVLDGQQRLAAIRDFVNGEIRVDGKIEPIDRGITLLDGTTYAKLPPEWRRRFDQFTIRVFRITDYAPGEPGELFYRLNQPTNLTAAEQRNAFFGPARQQVKDLVALLEARGIDKDFMGFSNSRMAYDDVVARVCCSLEVGTLAEKLTASRLAERYRSDTAFPEEAVIRCERAIVALGGARPHVRMNVRLNKATLYTWLLFIDELSTGGSIMIEADRLGEFFEFFELARTTENSLWPEIELQTGTEEGKWRLLPEMMSIYNDRSSARVADISSVLARDAVLWVALLMYCAMAKQAFPYEGKKAKEVSALLTTAVKEVWSGEKLIEEVIESPGWGVLS